ncbi:MAG: hypothetical protein KDI15_05175 [Thiothrix sp.]|nr:hypothetical protein [Thiothrix sp.]HPE59241.1 hypothetical protein [Thiolinea sp.]
MDIQNYRQTQKILPRQPDTQAQTRDAARTMNRFWGGRNPGSSGKSLQQQLIQLIQLLLNQWKNPGPVTPPPGQVQPVYGVIVEPEEPIFQPVYGVVIEPVKPEEPVFQPVYGVIVEPVIPEEPGIQPVYGTILENNN